MGKKKNPQETTKEAKVVDNGDKEVDTQKSQVRFRVQYPLKGPKKNFVEKDTDDKEVTTRTAVRKDSKANFDRNIPIKLNYGSFYVRTVWTIIMLVGFIVIILMGHVYCALFLILLDIGMVKEILSLKRDREKDSQVQLSQALNWWFFAVAVIYFYGKIFTNKLANFTLSNHLLYNLVNYHNFYCFVLWIIGFLMFTLSLKKRYLKYQFRQFAWVHMSVFLIIGQTSAIANNIFEGLIWFITPCLLVIANDTFAYIVGFFIGKTPLIQLSPKKTWEGFIGGTVCTILFGIFFSSIFGQIQLLVCPQNELHFKPFHFVTCDVSEVFVPYQVRIPGTEIRFHLTEFQIHTFVLGCFASFVSPFGGFFASGFKRAIKVKDFAGIIPGHGGITDRMDCQVLTGMFAYLYVHQIVYGKTNYVNGVTKYITNDLNVADQLILYHELKDILYTKGLLNITGS